MIKSEEFINFVLKNTKLCFFDYILDGSQYVFLKLFFVLIWNNKIFYKTGLI